MKTTARILLVFSAALGPLSAQKLVVEGHGIEDLGQVLQVADIDGDGKAEILAGAPRHQRGERHQQGRLFILKGGDGEDLDDRSVSWFGEMAGSRFGSSFAIGDVNGDGLPDILVGAPGTNESRGSCHLILGGKRGGAVLGGGVAGSNTLNLYGETRLFGFGRAVTLGDLNGDKLDDIIVAESYANVGTTRSAGRVWVFRGRKRFKKSKAKAGEKGMEADLIIVGREAESLGTQLLCEDLDGDGIDDLVLGSPDHRDGTGTVTVVRGRRDRFKKKATTIRLGRDDVDLVIRGNRGGRLGHALTGMDLDDDGTKDLLLSEPRRGHQRNREVGAVHAVAWKDTQKKLDLGRMHEKLKTVATLRGLIAFEQQGAALAAGRFGGGKTEDLLVGSPAIGRVVLFLDPPAFDPPPRPSRAFMPGGSGTKGFGAAVGAGDVDGDGKTEVVIAAPGASKIFIYALKKDAK
ncbi:MAG: hypothetical protein CMJ83_18200 [Planctomycetes bacterium]|nr:hypothetical protein [Planctomycetota bacterium]